MVAIVHPAMLYFAYINDPLIHLRKKVNLHYHPLKLSRLDAGDYKHKTPSRDDFLICVYHNIDFSGLCHKYVQKLRG